MKNKLDSNAKPNCGIGPGGFQQGNKCASIKEARTLIGTALRAGKIDHKEWNDWNQAQGKEVESAFLFNALINALKLPGKTCLDLLPKHIAGNEHRKCGTNS